MTTIFLRIHHNGNVLAQNPHWHIGVGLDGRMTGEILPAVGIRKEFHEQLTEADTQILFQTAVMMSYQFPPADQYLHHHHDDVCIRGNAEGKVLYRFVVPPKEQTRESMVEFFKILNRVIGKHSV